MTSRPMVPARLRTRYLPDFAVRSSERELLDEPVHDQSELDANLADIRRINRLLGGVRTTLRYLPALATCCPPDRPITILDIATGSADIPIAISRWAEHSRRSVHITATDIDDAVLAAARLHVGQRPDIVIERIDGRALPYPDASFDIALCSLALHHLAPADAIAVLAEMDRVSRVGFVVNDLRRSRLGWISALVMTRLTTRNRLTRNDAPLSIRRAYTPAELSDLLRSAGIHDASIRRHLWFRMAAVVQYKVAHDGA